MPTLHILTIHVPTLHMLTPCTLTVHMLTSQSSTIQSFRDLHILCGNHLDAIYNSVSLICTFSLSNQNTGNQSVRITVLLRTCDNITLLKTSSPRQICILLHLVVVTALLFCTLMVNYVDGILAQPCFARSDLHGRIPGGRHQQVVMETECRDGIIVSIQSLQSATKL